MQIFDGDSMELPVFKEICGLKEHTKQIISSGQYLTVNIPTSSFHYVMSTMHFKAIYTVFKTTCGGNFSTYEGYLASPNYPNSYPLNSECEWTIHASNGNMLRLQLLNINMLMTIGGEDYLEIRESNAGGRLLSLFSGLPTNGDNVLSVRLVTGAGFWIKFKTSDIGTEKGFELEYSYRK